MTSSWSHRMNTSSAHINRHTGAGVKTDISVDEMTEHENYNEMTIPIV